MDNVTVMVMVLLGLVNPFGHSGHMCTVRAARRQLGNFFAVVDTFIFSLSPRLLINSGATASKREIHYSEHWRREMMCWIYLPFGQYGWTSTYPRDDFLLHL